MRQADNFPTRWFPTRWRTGTILVLSLIALSLSGCLGLLGAQEEEQKLPIDMAQVVPKEWQPMGQFRPISVDNDPTNEYLLLYRYDIPRDQNGNPRPAPVGGIIYDTQTNPYSQWGAIPIPNNPAAQLVPYQLLPSYWKGAGQGFLADPGVGDAQVRVRRVKRTGAEAKRGPLAEPWEGGEQGPIFDELVVLGGRDRISVFWWKSKREGYGVAHMAASGWLVPQGWDEGKVAENEKKAAEDGDPEQAPKPIEAVQAYYPLNDRSALCHRSTFIRVLDPDQTTETSFRPAVKYQESPRFVDFCYGLPESSPFYPEATVLAYLRPPAKERKDSFILAESRERVKQVLADLKQMNQRLPGNGDFYVEQVGYAPAVPPQAFQETRDLLGDLFATVDLYVVVQREDGPQKRTYRFILKHMPPDQAGGKAAYWLISDVQLLSSQ